VSDGTKTLRNVAIIVALAVVVWKVPGGGTASLAISNLLSIILLGGLAFFGYRMYMEHRVSLDMLGDRTRAVLYGSLGLAVLAVVATSRMWNAGGPIVLLWFAMLGLAGYGVYSVWRSAREY
jgi:hypothetical protein